MIRSFRLFVFGIAITFGTPAFAHAMTFQFDLTKEGVAEFSESYIQLSIQGKRLTTLLPPVFYLVTNRSEKEMVVVTKAGKLSKNKPLSAALDNLVGSTPMNVKGPHGKPIFYNPAPNNSKLSAYTEWKEWLFLAGSQTVLINFLKGAATPQELVTPQSFFLSDGLPKTAPVRFWANNANGDFTALIRENQQRSIIPLLKEPDAVKRISGVLRLGPKQKVVATATAIPSKPKQRAALKKELELTLDSSRRLLDIFKVPSVGTVKESGKNLQLKMTIDDYLLGQPGLFKPPASAQVTK